MPAFLAPLVPAIAKGIGASVPYLLGGLFGGKSKNEKEAEKANAELLKIRKQLAAVNLQRQTQLSPLFTQLAGPSGISQLLPRYMQNQLTPTHPGPRKAEPRTVPDNR